MELQRTILNKLQTELVPDELEWVFDKLDQPFESRTIAFVMAHRFVSHDPVSGGSLPVRDISYTIDLSHWSKDQLVRTALLLSLDEGNESKFYTEIERLYQTADNRESQALYAAIPLFNYPQVWVQKATEAIRSNVGLIFDAMAFNNPYPATYFDDNAWNQMVLKTIFSDKPIEKITGLKERRNPELARAISDFAHERWAANRSLPPKIWLLTEPFPGDVFWDDVQSLLDSDKLTNQKAGYLLTKNQPVVPDGITVNHKELLYQLEIMNPCWSDLASTNPPA